MQGSAACDCWSHTGGAGLPRGSRGRRACAAEPAPRRRHQSSKGRHIKSWGRSASISDAASLGDANRHWRGLCCQISRLKGENTVRNTRDLGLVEKLRVLCSYWLHLDSHLLEIFEEHVNKCEDVIVTLVRAGPILVTLHRAILFSAVTSNVWSESMATGI